MSKFHCCLFLLFLVLFGCNSTREIPSITLDYDETLLDTLVVTAPRKSMESYSLPIYNPEATKKIDLIHMVLDIVPSWDDESVKGNAVLTLSPYFYPVRFVELDAVKMLINSVTMNDISLDFDYDGAILKIDLGKEVSKDQTVNLIIDYVARPTLGHIPNAGYRSNDQGLYYIEPDSEFPTKPYQIWSQGETEYNSTWFPTRDKPNEKYTHSILITVNDSLKTLSNGLLVEQKELPNNMRQDHWIMEKEHAPYLTMIAIGDYSITRDQWKNVPIQYYVYPEYEASAKSIFNHTPEMLQYFSDLTGVNYPWSKYAQIVVEDFVAGAMENTTAVTFGEFVQKTEEELIDNHNDDIVAHEMFHHWFGDYVTCESWANLTLNEGFANYSEYLWTAHKYGEDEAHNKRMSEWAQYIRSARSRGIHPLIHYSYENKERMFDAHSYNKGGLTLHYLRHIIGDDAFFDGMNTYLVDNAGQTVEIEQLRQAYEKTTGLDLKPFFNQWFLSAGHPDFEIYYSSKGDTFTIDVNQIQNVNLSIPIFEMPLEWEIHMKDGSVLQEEFYTKNRKSRFSILGLNPKEISWINFDPHHVFIGEYLESRDSIDYITEYLQGDQYDKREALDILRNFVVDESFYRDILSSETNYINKLIALARFKPADSDKELIISEIRRADHRLLTAELLMQYFKNPDIVDVETLRYVVANKKSMDVLALAMRLLYFHSPSDFENYFEKFSTQYPETFILAMSDFLSEIRDEKYINDLWKLAAILNEDRFHDVLQINLRSLSMKETSYVDKVLAAASEMLANKELTGSKKKLLKAVIRKRLITTPVGHENQVLIDKYRLRQYLD